MSVENRDSITATELVRKLSSMIDRVRISGKSLLITKGSQNVAELGPPPKSGLPIGKLARFMDSLPPLDADARSMAEDIKKLRDQARLPDSPWE